MQEKAPLLHHLRKACKSDAQIPASAPPLQIPPWKKRRFPHQREHLDSPMAVWILLVFLWGGTEQTLLKSYSSGTKVEWLLPAFAGEAPHLLSYLGFLPHMLLAQPGGPSAEPQSRTQLLGCRTIKLQHQSPCHFCHKVKQSTETAFNWVFSE